MNPRSRLVLGTAQLGMGYGIANKTGKPDIAAAKEMIAAAVERGLCEFDTAQAYGNSEEILGHCLSGLNLNGKVLVVSKIHPQVDHLDADAMQKALETTLKRLRCDRLYGYMLHQEELLDIWDQGLAEILLNFTEKERLVQNIGVAVYSPPKAVQALNHEQISLVQVPSNLLDHRFEKAGVFELAERLGKTVYVRSVYLQGLLLMDRAQLPGAMPAAGAVIKKIDDLISKLGISRLELAMGYAKHQYPHAQIIFGAETRGQVVENFSAWNGGFPENSVNVVHEIFSHVDEKILNPSLWPIAPNQMSEV